MALAGTLALTGCGSSSSGLSKSDLAAKTNTICTNSAASIKAIPQPADLVQNASSAAKYFDKIAAVYDKARSDLDALKPADSVKSQWNTLVSKFHALASIVDSIKTKAENKDRTGLQELTQVGPLTTSLNAATDAIGATACSKTTA